jgi:uncharacterized protein (DUF58 family)
MKTSNKKANKKEKNRKQKPELNLDIAGKVSELEILLKKVLPRNILWKIVLGKGLEFDGYRDYTLSDDSSLIDWKATVRAQKTLVKKYIEERDLKFMFFLDVSDNMIMGSKEKLKCEYAAELFAALAHLILTSGDRVGFVMYNNEIIKIKKPDVGTRLFDIIIHEVSNPSNYGGKSNLDKILGDLLKTMDKTTSLVFLISDFVKIDDSYRKNLEILASLYETIAIILRDPLDKTFPVLNKEVIIEDPETGEKLLVNPKVAKNIYEKNSLEQLNLVKTIFKDYNIDFLEISTEDSFPEKIAEFLKERIKGGRVVKAKNVH